jgi:hypothetical protein
VVGWIGKGCEVDRVTGGLKTGRGLAVVIIIFCPPVVLTLIAGCGTPGGSAGVDDGYELVYEDPEHHQVWWPEVDADGGMLLCERQINTYPLSDGGRARGIVPEPTRDYCLCVIMTLDLATGETRRLTNGEPLIWWYDTFADGERALVGYVEDEQYRTGIIDLTTGRSSSSSTPAGATAST